MPSLSRKITIPSQPPRTAPDSAQQQPERHSHSDIYRSVDINSPSLKRREIEMIEIADQCYMKWCNTHVGRHMIASSNQPLSEGLSAGPNAAIRHQVHLMYETAKKLLRRYDSWGEQSAKTQEKYRHSFGVITSDDFAHPDDHGVNFDDCYNTTKGLAHYKSALNMCLAEFITCCEDDYELSQKDLKRFQRALLTMMQDQHLIVGVDLTRNRTRDLTRDVSLNRREDIDLFQTDYQYRVMHNVRNEKYKDVFSVLSLTGCRPQELENGIIVKRVSDDFIALQVRNAKVDGIRIIGHTIDNDFAKQLTKNMDVGETKSIKVNAQALRQYIRDNRDEWGITNSDKLCAYSWRYSMATSCALFGMNEEDACGVMGHFDKRSRSHYIHKSRAKAVIANPMPKHVSLYK